MHLAKTLRAKGVRIIRHRVGSLDEAYSIPEVSSKPVKLVINATGLGSRTLIGVEDKKVYPARGQVVVAKGKGVRKLYGCRSGMPAGQSIYVIPRPGPDNLVILGGTYVVNEYNTDPDAATAERILQNAFKICPDLAGTHKGRTWRDIEVVKHQVGLRPNREGGIRVELVGRKIGDGVREEALLPRRVKEDMGREVAVVHAYGIGPAG
jgi:D-amino-acid oxidase